LVIAYLDASILVAVFINDPLSPRADRFLKSVASPMVLSDFGAAEFASAVARLVRMREIAEPDARFCLSHFDIWMARDARRIQTESADIAGADAFVRRLDLPLRVPDALHLAIAQRISATLVTFDAQMATNARTLGIAVLEP
jgi:predicted nucleic acid-binding protein